MFEDHPLFTLKNIYRAYCRCRRHKRKTFNAMIFEQNLEENLVALHEELTAGTYLPGRSVAFLITKPKQREIFAADFKDRVVHHILVGELEPRWERRFIHDSCACRKGKGTHKGVERLRSFTRKVTANGTRRAWYLQLDIRGFFITLNRNILYERLIARERDPAVKWLIQIILFNEPARNCRFRDAVRSDFECLPPHKTLFKADSGCGLPIGNLTSQFFANVYLDALDQFVKHCLKVQYYVRYCDDVVLLSENRAALEDYEVRIREFLQNALHLELNDRRRLRPVSDGIDFLGYIVRPDYLLVRRRVVAACRERLIRAEEECKNSIFALRMIRWHWPMIEATYRLLNSYLGHFQKASAYRLITGLRRRFPWLDEYFIWIPNSKNKIFALRKPNYILAYSCPRLRPPLRLSQQKVRLCRQLPGHILVVQVGNFWELWGGGFDLPKNLRRFPDSRLPEVREILWASGFPVAWIRETGTHVTRIAERDIVCRWTGRDQVLLSVFLSSGRKRS
jgi:hypothetical protein